MPRSLPVNFRIHIPEPVEVKMVSPTLMDRNAIDSLQRFKGLWTYVVEEDVFYYLSEGVTNEHWKPIGKPQVVEILEVFSNAKKTVISGYALENYLTQRYPTRTEVSQAIEAIKVADHVKNITPQQIQKWENIKGDYYKKVDFPEPRVIWTIPVEEGKNPSIETYTMNGNRIYGNENNSNPASRIFKWSQPIAGYALLN